jgi:dimethylamine monooxygenase subunit C
MLVQGIKSRPVYTGLDIDVNARRHLFALQGDGVEALHDQAKTLGTEFLKISDILCVGTLPRLEAEYMWAAPTIPVLLNRLRVNLINAKMGTRLYLSGTEGFIGQAMKVALDQNIDFNSIRTEHRGSTARRVQCVHCKGITDDVTTSPYSCTHCGLNLLVRDHYSRRLAAFQGVCIDAERPGTAPEPVEMFP